MIWQTSFLGGGSKITADGDCNHKIKRCLLLGRKAMTNLDSTLKSGDITWPTKVCLVKAMVFPVVMYGYERWSYLRSGASLSTFYTLFILVLISVWQRKVLRFYLFYSWAHNLNNFAQGHTSSSWWGLLTYHRDMTPGISDFTFHTLWTILTFVLSPYWNPT